MKFLRGAAFCLNTLVIYLGVPLLGWGLGDIHGFFLFYPRLGYALLVAAFSLIIGCQALKAPEGIRGKRGDESKTLRRQSIVSVAMILLLFAALFFLPFADRRSIGVMGNSLAMRWLGLLLTGLSFTLIFWSGITLGRMYSRQVTIQHRHQLITNGLYRYVRHPRYLGAMVLGFGMALLFRSWIALAAVVPFLGVILIRIKDEERVLHGEFKQDWEQYCKQSWRLIPFLY